MMTNPTQRSCLHFSGASLSQRNQFSKKKPRHTYRTGIGSEQRESGDEQKAQVRVRRPTLASLRLPERSVVWKCVPAPAAATLPTKPTGQRAITLHDGKMSPRIVKFSVTGDCCRIH